MDTHLREQARGPPVQVVARHDVVPRARQPQHRRQRRHAARERKRAARALRSVNVGLPLRIGFIA